MIGSTRAPVATHSAAVLWRAMDQMESVKGAERKGGKQADAASVAAVEQQWISMVVTAEAMMNAHV